MTKEHVVAEVIIHEASEMTDEGREQVAAWLHKQIGYFLGHAHELDKKFTTRYLRLPRSKNERI